MAEKVVQEHALGTGAGLMAGQGRRREGGFRADILCGLEVVICVVKVVLKKRRTNTTQGAVIFVIVKRRDVPRSMVTRTRVDIRRDILALADPAAAAVVGCLGHGGWGLGTVVMVGWIKSVVYDRRYHLARRQHILSRQRASEWRMSFEDGAEMKSRSTLSKRWRDTDGRDQHTLQDP